MQGAAKDPKRLLKLLIVFLAALAVLIGAVCGALLYQQFKDNEVILAPGVVVYAPGESSFDILEVAEDSVVVSSLEGLEDATVLNAGLTETTPSGLLRKLGEAQPVDGGYRIQTTQAALTDAIQKCNITFSAVQEEDGASAVKQGRDQRTFLYPELAYADDDPECFFSESYGPVDVQMGNKIEGHLNIEWFEVKSFRLVDHAYAGVSVDGLSFDMTELIKEAMKKSKEDGADAEDEEDGLTLLDKTIGKFPVTIGPVVLAFDVNLAVDLTMETACNGLDFEAGATFDRRFGFEYTSEDGFRVVNEDDSRAPYCTIEPEADIFSFQLDGGIKARLGFLLYGLAGPEASIGLQNELSACLSPVPEGVDDEGAIHIPGIDAGMNGRIREKLYVPIQMHVKAEADNLLGFINGELLNVNLLDAGDAITLLDVEKRFGTVWEPNAMALEDGHRGVTYFAPEEWEWKESSNFNAQIESRDNCYVAEILTPDEDADPSANVTLRFQYGDDFSVPGMDGTSVMSITEVAPSAFKPVRDDGTVITELGDFCVAEVAIVADTTYGSEGSVNRSISAAEQKRSLALVPRIWLGKHDTGAYFEFSMAFDYSIPAGASLEEVPAGPDLVPPANSLSFVFNGNVDELSDEDYDRVVQTLASLRAMNASA